MWTRHSLQRIRGSDATAATAFGSHRLDAQTVTIGGTIDGRVVVSNNTGENIEVIGCGSIFQVALANEEYEQQIGWKIAPGRAHLNRWSRANRSGEG